MYCNIRMYVLAVEACMYCNIRMYVLAVEACMCIVLPALACMASIIMY